jgi:hypothetical protein
MSTASFAPTISVEVLGSKAGSGPNGRTLSPTIAFSGAVKTLMFSGGDMLVGSSPLVFPRLYPRPHMRLSRPCRNLPVRTLGSIKMGGLK